MKAIGVAICVLFVAAPAFAQTSGGVMTGSGGELSDHSTTETSSEAATPAAEGERVICRRVEALSGSRVSSRRVCRTAEQWREAQRRG
jgi:hypothetical protein